MEFIIRNFFPKSRVCYFLKNYQMPKDKNQKLTTHELAFGIGRKAAEQELKQL
ncbi:MAG: hypothetical protein SFW35_06910 [Chitinophagales bacterium]|nr:hypothetical protein [Chitinophagales bacterium]